MPRRKSMYSMPKFKLRPKTIVSVGSLVAIILAIVSAASLFYSSPALHFWREVLLNSLGFTSFLTPVIFLVTALVIQKLKWPFAQSNVLVGLLVILVSVAGLIGAFSETAAGSIGLL